MVLLVLVGYAIVLIVEILVLVDAYKQGGAFHLCLCLFIPFYALYWIFFRMENRGRAIAALFVAAMLTAAPALQTRYAGGGSGGACSLLTAEQVGAELDGPFNEGKSYETHDMVGCRYTKTDVASK